MLHTQNQSTGTPETSSVSDTYTPPAETTETSSEPSFRHPQSFSNWYKIRCPHGINWTTTFWMAGIHIGGVAAFWHFSWAGLITLFVMHFVTACFGITLGYHRLLTHTGFVIPAPLKYFFSICGILSGEGSPMNWVATHRKHHALSDQEGDPHSPLDGFWWSHIMWLKPAKPQAEIKAMYQRYAPDMLKDPMQRFFDHTYGLIVIGSGVVTYLIGEYVIGGIGLSMFLWGFCLRMVFAYHSTWFVNSATHVWGYRNYKTRDQSRNLWWVALLSYGEGWHNNHHAHQRLARHGHRWWEFDVTYGVIWTMKKLGIAKDVKDQLPSR